MFEDRADAGRKLAKRLEPYRAQPNVVVLGIPRGGVVVAAEVARELGLPLDIAVAAKVGAPGNPEYAVGAVAAGGEVTMSPSAVYMAKDVASEIAAARDKVARYTGSLRVGWPPIDLADKVALLVDDGLATGLTAHAAARWVRDQGAARVVVAVPVASASAVDFVGQVADQVVTVLTPAGFYAVGQFYQHFDQTLDAEVRLLLRQIME